MSPTTHCPRCGGADGAHYAACTLTNLLQRWLGPDYPLYPPPPPPGPDHAPAVDALRDAVEQLRKDLDAAVDAFTTPPPPPEPKPDSADPRITVFGGTADDSQPQSPAPPQTETGGPEKPADLPTIRQDRPKSDNIPMADRQAWAERWIAENITPSNKPTPGPALNAAYNEWAAPLGGPPGGKRGPTAIGAFLTKAGYQRTPGGSYNAQIKAAGEPDLEQQMEERRAAEQAARAELPQPEPKPDKYRYTGPKPGQEVPTEYRKMLEPLWTQPGWSYAPHNGNGGGKPRVIAPNGAAYSLANTPSDVRGIKNARSALRRLGAKI